MFILDTGLGGRWALNVAQRSIKTFLPPVNMEAVRRCEVECAEQRPQSFCCSSSFPQGTFSAGTFRQGTCRHSFTLMGVEQQVLERIKQGDSN